MKQFMPELADHSDRLMQMQTLAAKVEKTTYQKQLTKEEIEDRSADHVEAAIKLEILEDELKEIKDTFATKMKPLKDAQKIRLQELKTRQTTVDGILYHIPVTEENEMQTFDEKGEWVAGRRLRPEEKVANVFTMAKTAN